MRRRLWERTDGAVKIVADMDLNGRGLDLRREESQQNWKLDALQLRAGESNSDLVSMSINSTDGAPDNGCRLYTTHFVENLTNELMGREGGPLSHRNLCAASLNSFK